MSTAFTLPDPGPPNLDFERPADRAHLDRTGGGAGLLGDGVADSAQIAELKGRDMGIDAYSSLFEAVPALAP
jgi:hypothetical protein